MPKISKSGIVKLRHSTTTSRTFSILGGFLVLAFMVVYYRLSGITADLALLLNERRRELRRSEGGGALRTLGRRVSGESLPDRESGLHRRLSQQGSPKIGHPRRHQCIVLVALLFLGGMVIRDFALSLAIGVVVGTYSSIFVASPIIYIWPEKHHRSKESRRLPA